MMCPDCGKPMELMDGGWFWVCECGKKIYKIDLI